MFRQSWAAELRGSDRYKYTEPWNMILFQNTIGHALELVRFRLGVNEMLTHKHRYCRSESEEVDMNCRYCINELEDEYLFLFRCKTFDVLRPSNFKHFECWFQLSMLSRLFSDESRSASCINQLARCISKALDKRNKCIQGDNSDAWLKWW